MLSQSEHIHPFFCQRQRSNSLSLRWRHQLTRCRQFPIGSHIGHEPPNRLLSETYSIKVADTKTDTPTLRVQFKLCLLTYKALHGLARSSYVADLCRPVTTVGSRQRLRSATHGDLVVASSVTNFGTRAFAVAVLRPGINCRCTYEHGSLV